MYLRDGESPTHNRDIAHATLLNHQQSSKTEKKRIQVAIQN